MRITPFIVIGIFLLLMLIGIGVDEPSRVLKLSTQVCLACIGIG